MKILSVRFKNLNSLVGEWYIDFQSPEFRSSSIFAIVGPTGSGKTTILDAICLSLYGRTPRLKQISKTSNDLMSKHTGECFAEVCFISQKGRFRCHWSQHRARKNAKGDLQPAKHEIVNDAGNTILATKLKEVQEKVIELTGMNFEQFSRSVLLAQGEFARFLQATSNDRAPILEQITGTEIYSLISQQVHSRTNLEHDLLIKLKMGLENLLPLSAEQEKEQQKKAQQLQAEVSQLQKNIELITSLSNWHDTINQLGKKLASIEHRAMQAESLWQKNSCERERLRDALTAKTLQPSLYFLQQQRTLQATEQNELINCNNRKQQLTEKLVTKKKQRTELTKQQETLTDEKDAIEKVIRQVVHLDLLIKTTTEELAQNQKGSTSLSEKTKQLTEIIESLEKEVAEQKKLEDDVKRYLDDHRLDATLQESFSGFTERCLQVTQSFTHVKRINEKRIDIQTKIKVIESAIDNQKTEHKSITEKLISQQKEFVGVEKELAELSEYSVSKLHEQRAEIHEKILLCKAASTLTTQIDGYHKKLTSYDNNQQELAGKINDTEKEVVRSKEHLEFQKKAVETQEKLTHLALQIKNYEQDRSRLVQGSPCPLCGATDHPFSHEKSPDFPEETTKLQEEKKLFEHCANRHNNLLSALTRLKAEQEQVTRSLEETKRLQRSLEQELIEKLQQINLTLSPNLEDTIKHLAIDLETNDSSLTTTLTKLEHLTKQKEIIQKELHRISSKEQKLASLQQLSKQELLSLHEQQNSFEVEQQRLAQQLNTDLSFLNTLSSPYNIEVTDLNSLVRAENSLRQRLDGWKQNIQKQKDIQKQVQQSENQLAETTLQQKHFKTDLEKLAIRTTELHKKQTTLRDQRYNLFGEQVPDQVEKVLREQIRKVTEKHTTNLDEIKTIENELSSVKGQIEQLQANLSQRTTVLQKEESRFSNQLKENNFHSEKALLASILPEDELTALQIKTETEKREKDELQTQAKLTRQQIKNETDKNLTDQPQQTLLEELAHKNRHLSDLQEEVGAIKISLANHKEIMAKVQSKQKLIAAQEKEYGYWKQLHDLIGSNDGKKFRNFAQGLTFETMIYHSNTILTKMSDRYLLKRNPKLPLELSVIDGYQAGEVRSTANLSGGESFIISLALALGLSAMASQKVQVDSFFLDEGFGTLDEESLEVALETLGTLEQDGKLIGIISHIPLLKERIPLKLSLAAGLDGRSTLYGPGVSHIN